MAILLLIILVIVIGSKVVYKDNFAILTGTITGDGTESPSSHIAFPEGFNRDNCVILTANLQRTANDNKGYGAIYDSASYVTGSIPLKIVMDNADILLEIRNVLLGDGNKVTIPEMSTSVSYNYTIVLMKIGD